MSLDKKGDCPGLSPFLGVVLDIEEHKRIPEDLEELEAIRAYDDAKSADDEAIPFGQAVDEIKANSK